MDFRVESNDDANMFFVDAGNNRIGIRQSSPDSESLLDLGSGENSGFNRKLLVTNTGNSRAGFGALSNIFRMFYASDQNLQFGTVTRDGNFTFAEKMRLDNNGKLLVGMTSNLIDSPNNPRLQVESDMGIHVSNASNNQTAIIFQNDNGRVGFIDINSNSISVNGTSDYRLKENVVTDWNATNRLKQLKPIRFNFITDADSTLDGFLAHEVSSVVPEAVSGSKDATDDDNNIIPQGFDPSKLVPLLVKTIQELEARITTLENA
jgi:hypothetical protein